MRTDQDSGLRCNRDQTALGRHAGHRRADRRADRRAVVLRTRSLPRSGGRPQENPVALITTPTFLRR
ncbi:hypothetical protein KL942_002716 [Ogataea angusta]|uniref:Uncharacterized protein n=1 Tax=Pichia angusta TaxID=870730 RepID=A0ABQ7RSM2_PICAN|nr:hypothetical protein KL920_002798 [Ogataea angusta]KAG7839917.1 hypothetical protein KL942_002716 [Ogataea angusta]KAG7842510.1 hypothetical protein KL941_005174 [Ogataea angusta]KAG7846576.1 hypothetical protein KL940_004174 [Ogataea angusta]KAG7859110.1 hypothetical protein KL919_003175 [Ogataea angusta]